MKTPEKPWGKAVHIYERPLREEDIVTNIQVDPDRIRRTTEITRELQYGIDRSIKSLGLKGINVLSMSRDVREGQLGAKIKSDSGWQRAYEQLLDLLAPRVDPELSVSDLTRTDWNSPQLGLLGYSFDGEKLTLSAEHSHSYIDILSGAKNPDGSKKYPQLKKMDPMSVGGFIVTSDNFLVLGYRGGINFNDTVMLLPAGSVEPHSGVNPLYESIDKENLEEVLLTRERWYPLKESGLVTMTFDITANRSYAVFQEYTDYTLSELVRRWEIHAKDRGEHRHLVPLHNDPEYVLKEIERKRFDHERADLPLSKTSGINYGAILPQCALGVLSVYAQRQGIEWARRAEQDLGGLYDLSAGFELKPLNEK
jgi:hypothetical protein